MDKEKIAEKIMHEQFWFTATTLGFIGFIGTSSDVAGTFKGIVLSMMVVLISSFTVYILVKRYRQYRKSRREGDGECFRGALQLVLKEREGSLYCVVVVIMACVGVVMSLWVS